MSDSILPPPPYNSPLTTPQRVVDVGWLNWFKQLYIRVGQQVALTNLDIGSGGITGYVGAGGITETTFTLINNTSSPSNVTGLFFGPAVQTAEIDVQFYRHVGSTEYVARGQYLVTNKPIAATWDITCLGIDGDIDPVSGEPAGITLSISSGQVQYTSTNISGASFKSSMHFIARTMST